MARDMRCADCRDVLSADLDGEATPAELTQAQTHLAGCPACREHATAMARVTRLTRMSPAESVPDLTAAVLAAAPSELPAPRPSRRVRIVAAVRMALAGFGIGQLALAVHGVTAAGAVADGSAGQVAQHVGHAVGAGPAHLLHEGAAWNLALAVAFLLAAAVSTRAESLAPVVGAFVGVLALLSVGDLLAGRVQPQRLFSHSLAVGGFVLLVWLHRATRHTDDPAGRTQPADRVSDPHVTVDPATRHRDDGPDTGHGGLSPVARTPAA